MPSRCMTRHFERVDLARKRNILNAGRSKAERTGEHARERLFGLTHHSARTLQRTSAEDFVPLCLNPNTLKVSYSCMPNMAAVIRQHNSTIINSQPSAPHNAGSASKCNCRVKANCPMNGECLVQSVVYRATVRSQDTEKDYTGLTASTFKQRFNSHQHSMRHRKYRHSTALSNYVWSLKDQDIAFDIKWTVLRKAAAYRNTTRRCNLCIAEKLEIMKADKDRSLNRRSELVSKCRCSRVIMRVRRVVVPKNIQRARTKCS